MLMWEEIFIITSFSLEVLLCLKVLEKDYYLKLNKEPQRASKWKLLLAQIENSLFGEEDPHWHHYQPLPACGLPRMTTKNMEPKLFIENAFEITDFRSNDNLRKSLLDVPIIRVTIFLRLVLNSSTLYEWSIIGVLDKYLSHKS